MQKPGEIKKCLQNFSRKNCSEEAVYLLVDRKILH